MDAPGNRARSLPSTWAPGKSSGGGTTPSPQEGPRNRLTGYLAVSDTHIFSGTIRARCGHSTPDGRSRVAPPSPVPRGLGHTLLRRHCWWAALCRRARAAAPICCATSRRRRRIALGAREDEPTEIEPRVSFRIEQVHARQKLTRDKAVFAGGGPWTVLRCTLARRASSSWRSKTIAGRGEGHSGSRMSTRARSFSRRSGRPFPVPGVGRDPPGLARRGTRLPRRSYPGLRRRRGGRRERHLDHVEMGG